MIAQDTGSAIVGPARADLYFGAGSDAGKVSGRLRHNMRFVMLVPKTLDPVRRGRKMPLPDPRPSENIAKLFPEIYPPKHQQEKNGPAPAQASAAPGVNEAKRTEPTVNSVAAPAVPAAAAAQASATQTAAAIPIPLPEARPNIQQIHEALRYRRSHRHRRNP